MSKKDTIIIVLIAISIVVLLFFGYNDYKRQKGLKNDAVGEIIYESNNARSSLG